MAGSHSTSGTLTLLLWHLTHNPSILATVTQELHEKLPPLHDNKISYPIEGLESILSYTMACVRENFRMNPVFNMPLWRRVGYPGGIEIAGHHIPEGVSYLSAPFPSPKYTIYTNTNST